MDKLTYATQYQQAVTAVGQANEMGIAGERMYFERGWNVGGSDEITDTDLSGTGFTADTLASAITLFQQLNALLNNQATTPGNYIATVDRMRTKL